MFTRTDEIFRKYKGMDKSYRVLAYMVMRNINSKQQNYLYIKNFIQRIESIEYRALFIYRGARSLCSHPGFITGFEEFEAALFLSITAQYSEMYPELRKNKLKLYCETFDLIENELEKIYKNQLDEYKYINLLYSEAFTDYCAYNKGLMPPENFYNKLDSGIIPDYEAFTNENGDIEIKEVKNDEDDEDPETPFDYNKDYSDTP